MKCQGLNASTVVAILFSVHSAYIDTHYRASLIAIIYLFALESMFISCIDIAQDAEKPQLEDTGATVVSLQ